MSKTVIGLFDTALQAQTAAAQLIQRGFLEENVDISASATGSVDATTTTHESDNDTGIGNFFKSLFGSDTDDADKYSHVARRGSIVTVHNASDVQARLASDILDEHGAVDIDEKANEYGYVATTATGSTPYPADYQPTEDSLTVDSLPHHATSDIARDEFTADNQAASAKVIEENLQVGKRSIETGGARLRSRIVERSVEENVRLRQERVVVNRTPVDRPATDADFATFQEGQIDVVEHAEVPVVSKEARVVEEVTLGKEVDEHVETVRDTVRHTEVDVDTLNTNERGVSRNL
ncbi:YsnF/AvaK domain-containing protein [Siphonobacter curvatus]|uniref:DUF2382 domain-containing protein n=1 Tax=Siphonobacter curvatus TaxID=2094562 RepID=A0A2S7II41_9BACT|nr:YsnF/AvaK domain-containing protein [Siphonobacter curvatus]PQA55605.1 hypothetical protein C5O19_19515 [Siphonobacter curvatus]